MVKFKFDIDYLLYAILLFIIAFLCYKVYTLSESSEIHYLQMCEHEEKNKFNIIFYDQTIENLKKSNRELYDSIKMYKEEIDYLVKFKYNKDYIFDTVFIEKENDLNMENEQVFEYKSKPNDTLNYTLQIGSLYEPNWYKLKLMVSEDFTITNKRYDDKNATNITTNSNANITDVTAFKKKEKNKFIDNFFFGPSITAGYDIINNDIGLVVGVSFGYKIDFNK